MADESPPPEMLEYLRKVGKKYGALGGTATAQSRTAAERKRSAKKAWTAAREVLMNLTPEERKARASAAAAARWAKKRKKPPDK